MLKMWSLAALALLASNACADEACGPLKIFNQVDMLSTQDKLLVPATVNGHPIRMIFDTGGWFLELSPALVKRLDLPTARRLLARRDSPTTHIGFGMVDVNGNAINKTATASEFAIGSLKAKNVAFLVPDEDYDGFDGLMGPKLAEVADVDLDFGAKKIRFALQDHCPGKVIYWKTPSYTVVPFVLTDEGHIRMPVTLDGVKFTAILDTGASHSFISQRAAEGAFGIGKNSAGVTETGPVNGDKSAKKYARAFKTLAIGGITLDNPVLEILPDLIRNHVMNAHAPPLNSHIPINKDAEGLDDVGVGLEELRHLHVYIAYGEQKLYISPISAEQADTH